jgi:ribosomal protein L37AE/L43A
MLICVKCQLQMRVKKNGFPLVAMAGRDAYQLWSSDLWECPSCGASIANPATTPIAEHFQPEFDGAVKTSLANGAAQFWVTAKDRFETALAGMDATLAARDEKGV